MHPPCVCSSIYWLVIEHLVAVHVQILGTKSPQGLSGDETNRCHSLDCSFEICCLLCCKLLEELRAALVKLRTHFFCPTTHGRLCQTFRSAPRLVHIDWVWTDVQHAVQTVSTHLHHSRKCAVNGTTSLWRRCARLHECNKAAAITKRQIPRTETIYTAWIWRKVGTNAACLWAVLGHH